MIQTNEYEKSAHGSVDAYLKNYSVSKYELLNQETFLIEEQIYTNFASVLVNG
jgi:hypothetical protein